MGIISYTGSSFRYTALISVVSLMCVAYDIAQLFDDFVSVGLEPQLTCAEIRPLFEGLDFFAPKAVLACQCECARAVLF